ncbi:hypothetical protein CALCODRAFT_510069 [Calocera cornea HHB12733]|uniref:Uncharacterized protein n=1 Tax=Calocera cornea HHB12733 TaxID=1353952 RepID=A0A165EUH7_9BASI|nr:hypothetical protein CALCODRAFT_510069 [Calocera cornea HHB12733]
MAALPPMLGEEPEDNDLNKSDCTMPGNWSFVSLSEFQPSQLKQSSPGQSSPIQNEECSIASADTGKNAVVRPDFASQSCKIWGLVLLFLLASTLFVWYGAAEVIHGVSNRPTNLTDDPALVTDLPADKRKSNPPATPHFMSTAEAHAKFTGADAEALDQQEYRTNARGYRGTDGLQSMQHTFQDRTKEDTRQPAPPTERPPMSTKIHHSQANSSEKLLQFLQGYS